MKPKEFYLHALRAHCVPASSVTGLKIENHKKGCSLMVTHQGRPGELGIYFAKKADAELVKKAFAPKRTLQMAEAVPAKKLAFGG